MSCNEFIDYMYDKLPIELIQYIVSKYIFLPSNILKIKKQKLLKKGVLKQLLFISNIIYIDNKICVYSNKNSIIFHNNNDRSSSYMSLYGLNENIETLSNVVAETPSELNAISARLNEIQTNFNNIFNTNTTVSSSNIVINEMEFSNIFNAPTNEDDVIINTTHDDMSNVSVYIMYV